MDLTSSVTASSSLVSAVSGLRADARQAWLVPDPDDKCVKVNVLRARCLALIDSLKVTQAAPIGQARDMALQARHLEAIDIDDLQAGAPTRPRLVHPRDLSRRATAHAGGRAALLHAIAHIEFNAINLALDAAWRYPAMPVAFLFDWLSVAADEARHFTLLTKEMASSGVSYGDFDAHDGLWEMARKTAPDLQARMALVPRVLEARGLDATPQIQRKLRAAGDDKACALLQIILDDEVGHVRIGDQWFRAVCRSHGNEPEACYRRLIEQFNAPRPRGPLNEPARRLAGFSERELCWLREGAKHTRPA